ncbi:hypothetical protein KIPB_011933, partial [Kipferlia bialata]
YFWTDPCSVAHFVGAWLIEGPGDCPALVDVIDRATVCNLVGFSRKRLNGLLVQLGYEAKGTGKT